MIWEGKEVLHLVLMKDPFERIMNGTKTIEYRDRTDYWNRRLYGKNIKWIYFQYFTTKTQLIWWWNVPMFRLPIGGNFI